MRALHVWCGPSPAPGPLASYRVGRPRRLELPLWSLRGRLACGPAQRSAATGLAAGGSNGLKTLHVWCGLSPWGGVQGSRTLHVRCRSSPRAGGCAGWRSPPRGSMALHVWCGLSPPWQVPHRPHSISSRRTLQLLGLGLLQRAPRPTAVAPLRPDLASPLTSGSTHWACEGARRHL